MNLTAFEFLKLQSLKTFLDKCLKSPVSEDASTGNIETYPSTVEICITAPLSYSFLTNKEIVFGNVSLIDIQNFGTSC